MIRNFTLTFAVAAVLAAFAANSAVADAAPENLSMHNIGLPADVDANGTVDENDLNLLFSVIRDHQASPLVAPLASTPDYFWDTSGNGRVNSQDALVVINYMLTTPVPEPSTFLTAGLALAGMAGYCWRRQRRTAGQSKR